MDELDLFMNPAPVTPASAQDSLEEATAMAAKDLINAASTAADVEKYVKDFKVDAEYKEDSTKTVKYADKLAVFVKDCFEASESARSSIESDWLDSLRQYKGQYPSDTLARIPSGRSRAFVRVTRTKVRTVDSRLSDLLFPANGDKNWEIMPTPFPDMPAPKKKAIADLYTKESGTETSPEKLDVLIQGEAAKQARKMSKVIEDQLAETKYREILRDVIHSGNVYGTGILKGPLVSIKENQQYYKKVLADGSEEWLLKDYDRIIPFIENVRLWDIYPDMEATTFSDCRFIIQRRKMNKHDLVGLAKRADFSKDAINKYLRENPAGDYEKKDFEVHLQTMGDIIGESVVSESRGKKYEVLEYWGYVDADDLASFGVEIPESKAGTFEVPANIWVLGDRIIKATLTPMEGIKWPFFVYYFDKDETSIFGEGIPSIMHDMQELTNSAFRAMVDNSAISAGPQVEVNEDLLSEDEDPRDIHPFKVWLRTGTGLDASNPCLRVFNMPSYTPEFEKMINIFKEFSDEVTTIPRYMWGDASGGAGRTSSGLSMLMGSANMSIKDQVKNFDDGITTPFITAMYHWNMQFNSDDDIKGDYAIVARGSASLIAKEMYTQYLINFAQMTANAMDANIVRRPEVIRSIADAFDLNSDKFVLSPEEITAQQQQQQQQAAEEKMFMDKIIESAREEGVSPDTLLTNMRELFTQQQQQQQAAPAKAQPFNPAIMP
jgi:hypothetical protein